MPQSVSAYSAPHQLTGRCRACAAAVESKLVSKKPRSATARQPADNSRHRSTRHISRAARAGARSPILAAAAAESARKKYAASDSSAQAPAGAATRPRRPRHGGHAEPSAKVPARGPGPTHFAHIEANEMLSWPKIGAGMSVTCGYATQQRQIAIPAAGDGRQGRCRPP